MKQTKRLDDILAPVITSMGYDYVGCEHLPQQSHSLLRVYIDKPGGVSIDDCTSVSRQVGSLLDVEEPIKNTYTLEVSSPGIERPLFNLAQFKQFIGEQVAVKLYSPINKRRNVSGELIAVNDDSVTVKDEQDELTVPFAAIAKAHLVAGFN